MSTYTHNPQTIDEAIGNVQFQLDNVIGWNSVGNINNAAAKANCLLNAAKVLLEKLESVSIYEAEKT